MGALKQSEAFFDVWFDGGWNRQLLLAEAMVVIDGKEHHQEWFGSGESNHTEVRAAILACQEVLKTAVPPGAILRFIGDSELVVNFMKGKAQPNKLADVVDELRAACAGLPPIQWQHVDRKDNMAGRALERLQARRSRSVSDDQTDWNVRAT